MPGPDEPRRPPTNGRASGSATGRRPGRRASLLVALLVAGSIALPALFWRDTWFGAPLTIDQMRDYLTSNDRPRRTQHALVQMSERIASGDRSVVELYPLVVRLADHENRDIRNTAAWVMGGDSSSGEFHRALRRLVEDDGPLVRRNAALGLSNFGDPTARGELLAMLGPFDVASPATGKVSRLMGQGREVRALTELATVTTPSGRSVRVPSPLNGWLVRHSVTDGSTVQEGDVLCTLGPAEQDMHQALLALERVGTEPDLDIIREAIDRLEPSEAVVEQARKSSAAIKERTRPGKS